MFPAVNPLYSTSSVSEGVHLDQVHLAVQQRAQKAAPLSRVRSLVQVRGLQAIPASETEVYERGARLEAYLTRPFTLRRLIPVYRASEWICRISHDVQAILNGGMDHRSVESLSWIGTLK